MNNLILDAARETIETELREASRLTERLNDDFLQACERIHNCSGKVIVSGIGKSGHIGRKIAATLASTGTPAFYVHPAEALHGDLGMIVAGDVVILIASPIFSLETHSGTMYVQSGAVAESSLVNTSGTGYVIYGGVTSSTAVKTGGIPVYLCGRHCVFDHAVRRCPDSIR